MSEEQDETLHFLSPGRPSGPAPAIERIAGYEILEELARGGMGVVYRARQAQLDRIVALKVILSTGAAQPEQIERFFREARSAARLHHPGIVPIHDMGRDGGLHYYTMELVDGSSLHERLAAGEVELRQGLEWMRQVCEAMAYAHLNGIYHRDLKPGNILIGAGGRAMVTDFGLAKDRTQSELTRTGDILGTPQFMAPEQLGYHGGVIDAATDIYALGTILYLIVAGELPFGGDSPAAMMHNVGQGNRRALAAVAPQLDRDLQVLIEKAFAYRKEQRYPSATALALDIEHYLAGEPIAARPPGRLERARRFYRANRLPVNLTLAFLSVVFGLLLHALRLQAQRSRLSAEQARLFQQQAEAATRAYQAERALADARRRRLLASPFYGRGRFYGQTRAGYSAAVKHLTRAIELDPGYADAYLERGMLHARWGKALELAIADYRKALEFDPKALRAYKELSDIHDRRGEHDAGARLLARAVREIPGTELLHYDRAWHLHQLGRYAEAARELDRVLQINPGNPFALRRRVDARGGLGDFPGALRDIQRLLRLHPGDKTHLALRAWYSLLAGRTRTALNDYLAVGNTFNASLLQKQLDGRTDGVQLRLTPHYLIFSDAPSLPLLPPLLEAAHQALRRRFGGIENQADRLKLYLYRHPGDYARHHQRLTGKPTTAGGLYWPATGCVLCLEQSTPHGTRRRLLHALLLQYLGHRRNLPRWAREGLAESFAHHRWKPPGELVTDLWDVPCPDDDPGALSSADRFAAIVSGQQADRTWAWAIVAFLAARHPKVWQRFLEHQGDHARRFVELFGPPDKLAREFRRFWQTRRRTWRVVRPDWELQGVRLIGASPTSALLLHRTPASATGQVTVELIDHASARRGVVFGYVSEQRFECLEFTGRSALRLLRFRDGKWQELATRQLALEARPWRRLELRWRADAVEVRIDGLAPLIHGYKQPLAAGRWGLHVAGGQGVFRVR